MASSTAAHPLQVQCNLSSVVVGKEFSVGKRFSVGIHFADVPLVFYQNDQPHWDHTGYCIALNWVAWLDLTMRIGFRVVLFCKLHHCYEAYCIDCYIDLDSVVGMGMLFSVDIDFAGLLCLIRTVPRLVHYCCKSFDIVLAVLAWSDMRFSVLHSSAVLMGSYSAVYY